MLNTDTEVESCKLKLKVNVAFEAPSLNSTFYETFWYLKLKSKSIKVLLETTLVISTSVKRFVRVDLKKYSQKTQINVALHLQKFQ